MCAVFLHQGCLPSTSQELTASQQTAPVGRTAQFEGTICATEARNTSNIKAPVSTVRERRRFSGKIQVWTDVAGQH